VRRPRLPFARGRASSAEESPPSSPEIENAGTQKPSTAPTASAPSRASATPQASAAPEARADPQERIDGLGAWIAQVDRKLGVRTYVGAAIAVLALAAAAVGLALTLSLKQDAATDEDIQSLRDQIAAVELSASQAAQKDVQELDKRLAEVQAQVNKLDTGQTTARRELKVVQDDIKELRSDVARARSSAATGGSQETPQGSAP
jgi:uncharacterized protein HemX